jgi:hypothetical protein
VSFRALLMDLPRYCDVYSGSVTSVDQGPKQYYLTSRISKGSPFLASP